MCESGDSFNSIKKSLFILCTNQGTINSVKKWYHIRQVKIIFANIVILLLLHIQFPHYVIDCNLTAHKHYIYIIWFYII